MNPSQEISSASPLSFARPIIPSYVEIYNSDNETKEKIISFIQTSREIIHGVLPETQRTLYEMFNPFCEDRPPCIPNKASDKSLFSILKKILSQEIIDSGFTVLHDKFKSPLKTPFRQRDQKERLENYNKWVNQAKEIGLEVVSWYLGKSITGISNAREILKESRDIKVLTHNAQDIVDIANSRDKIMTRIKIFSLVDLSLRVSIVVGLIFAIGSYFVKVPHLRTAGLVITVTALATLQFKSHFNIINESTKAEARKLYENIVKMEGVLVNTT